jgi:hypothetical protein
MEFEEVLLLPETKKLISETPNLEKFLLTRILERCRSGKAAGSGPEVYYSFLFCKLKGINISSLLQIAASHEQDLDYVIAAVFSDGSTDKSEWDSSWNNGTSRKKQKKLREGDPFRDG